MTKTSLFYIYGQDGEREQQIESLLTCVFHNSRALILFYFPTTSPYWNNLLLACPGFTQHLLYSIKYNAM